MKTNSTIKSLFLSISILLSVTIAEAQTVIENFDNVPSLLTGGGWDTINRSNPSTSYPCWFRGIPASAFGFNAYNGTDTSYMASSKNGTTFGGTLSSWLIAPVQTIRNGDVFSFYTRELYGDGLFHSKFEFRLSTNGTSSDVGPTETSTGDFSTLLSTINFSSPDSVTWTQHSVTISGLSGPTSGRVAFRNISTTANNYFGIDNFVYTSVCSGVTITPISLPLSFIASDYTDTLHLLGAVGTPTFTFDSGALPPGLTLVDSVISGNSTATGTYAFQITGTDANGCSATLNDGITILCQGVNILLPTFPDVCMNTPPFTLPPSDPPGGVYSCLANPLAIVNDSIFDATNYGFEGQSIVYTYTDTYGCASSQSFQISGLEPPSVEIAYPADDICFGETLTLYNLGTADSNYFANGIVNNVTFTPPVGAATYYLYAYNFNGCMDSTNLTITVHDVPVITCSGNLSVNNENGLCGAVVNFVLATATGIADITYSDTSGIYYPKGNYVITVTADNICGTDNCSFVVDVNDTELPVITCPADISVTVHSGICSTNTIMLGMATATDNCDVPTITNDAPTDFPIGITIVTWAAEDASGNIADCAQAVTVTQLVDNTDVTICSNQSIIVGTNTYNTTGDYTDTLTSITSCDSIVITHLTVLTAPVTPINQSICFGSSINIGTHTYNTTGTYADTLAAFNGCDSIINTNLTVLSPITGIQSPSICVGATFTVGSSTYNSSGIYTDVLTAASGCDSTVTTNLTVMLAITASQSVSICSGSSYSFGGNTYSASGIYTDVLTAASGCDSTVTLALTVMSAITYSQSVTLCSGDSITVGSSTYHSAGIYTDVMPAFNFCDSTVTTTLTVMPAIGNSQTLTLCAGQSVTVGTNTYNATGIYTDVFSAANGCDSIYTTNLTVLTPIAGSVTASLCTGNFITVGTSTYSTTGTYTDVLTSFTGCDSTVTTDLTVASVLTASQTINLCYGAAFTIGVHTYNASGTYTDSLTALGGCDSVVTTDLTINSLIIASQSIVICAGSSLSIGIHTYSTSGVYTDSLTSFGGCDSVLTTNLSINTAIIVDAGIDQSICISDVATLSGTASGGALPYSYLWSTGDTTATTSVNPTTSTPYTFTVTDSMGCGASDFMNITVIPGSDFYGQITSATYGNIQFGFAVLFRWQPIFIHFDTIATSGLDASGYYHFANVPVGNYIIEAFADPTFYITPGTMPTYYDTTTTGISTIFWDSAFVLQPLFCGSSDTFNIAMREQMLLTGSGHLHGRVIEGTGYHTLGDPISGTDIKLGHIPPGQNAVVNSTTSSPDVPAGAGGYYDFYNVPDGTYYVYADIPGLHRDTLWMVTVNAATGDTLFDYLNYIADTNSIYITGAPVLVASSSSEGADFTVYPNPLAESATIEYTLAADTEVMLDVYNVLGMRVQSMVNSYQQSGRYKYTLNSPLRQLSAGVYFVSLSVDGIVSTQKILVMK